MVIIDQIPLTQYNTQSDTILRNSNPGSRMLTLDPYVKFILFESYILCAYRYVFEHILHISRVLRVQNYGCVMLGADLMLLNFTHKNVHEPEVKKVRLLYFSKS